MKTSSETVIDAIQGCKLFAASCVTSKQKILAAIQDPRNMELVEQLSSYLSEETKADLKQSAEAEAPDEGASNSEHPDTYSADTSRPGRVATEIKHVEPAEHEDSESTDVSDKESDSSTESDEESSNMMLEVHEPLERKESSSDTNGSEAEIVSSSTATSGSCVTSTCTTSAACGFVDCDVLQGTLNNREETAGVTRVRTHEDEVWVYYNDKTNLNNIMLQVVELVSNSEFMDLEFNRLARTENAMVFQYIPKTC